MKRFFAGSMALLVVMTTGCVVGDKDASYTTIYLATAVMALLVLVGYLALFKKRDGWFITLFASVPIVNIGYFFLASSSSLGEALLANRIAYLGSVALPYTMFFIILNVTKTRVKKWLPFVLGAISAGVFLLAASPGYLDLYYKEVSFAVVGGVGTLVKVYGPLHPLYLAYLLGYFVAMVTAIIRAIIKKRIEAPGPAIVLATAGLVNICVWLVEQISDIQFEMLAISYIISELFLLSAHYMMSENQRMKELVRQSEKESPPPPALTEEQKLFLAGLETLTPKERLLFDAYVAGMETPAILEALQIKENTLKFHSKNLYSKLGVTSRKQLVAIYKKIGDR